MQQRFGVVAAGTAALAAILYAVPQLLQVFGVLGDPWDRILIFAPSLALAPAFVLAVAAAHIVAPSSRLVWSLGALALAILYAADVSMIYVVQLAVVIPRDVSGHGSNTAFAACCRPGAPTTAVDVLGYTYMSAATLLLAPVFPGGGLRRWLRLALIVNGLLGPIILAQLAWPWLIYAASPWIVTFPAAMILLAVTFGRSPARTRYPHGTYLSAAFDPSGGKPVLSGSSHSASLNGRGRSRRCTPSAGSIEKLSPRSGATSGLSSWRWPSAIRGSRRCNYWPAERRQRDRSHYDAIRPVEGSPAG